MKLMRIQRALLLVKIGSFDKVRTFYSELLGETLEEVPSVDKVGVRAAVAWGVGLELVAPLPGTKESVGVKFADFLEKHGEGLIGAAYLVEDIEKTRLKAKKLGMRDPIQLELNEDEIKALGMEKVWGKKFKEDIYNAVDSYGVTIIFNEFGL